MWKCPECRRNIEHLNYSANTRGYESGDADLTSEFSEGDRIIDWNYQDGETNDTFDYMYNCPECDMEISPDQLLWEDEENEEITIKKPEITEEEGHAIIKPKFNIMARQERQKTENYGIVCKQCQYAFAYSPDTAQDEEFFPCPKCEHVNSKKEYNKELYE